MLCKKCGHDCLEGNFCSECGTRLDAVTQENKPVLPTIEELKETIANIENDTAFVTPTDDTKEEDVIYITREEYDAALEKVEEFKKRTKLAFSLVFVSIALSFSSFFSFIYLFSNVNDFLGVISMLSAYLNIPALIISLIAFSVASHWFLAAREYRFLKKPPFITWTFLLSIFAIIFTSVCFCMTTLTIMLF